MQSQFATSAVRCLGLLPRGFGGILGGNLRAGFSSASLPAKDATATGNLPTLPPFDYTPLPYDGPSKEEVLELRQKYLNPVKFLHFKEPVMIVEGKMQYLFDERGRRFLDAFAGIVTISAGHCHPKVVDAITKQLQRIQHTTTIYLNEQIALYGKELADAMPGNLKNVYFVNSGSEANDLAMTMARLYTGNFDLLALRNCYHGASPATMGLTAHSTWKYNTPHGFGVHHVMNPDPYRGVFGNDGKVHSASLFNAPPPHPPRPAECIPHCSPLRC